MENTKMFVSRVHEQPSQMNITKSVFGRNIFGKDSFCQESNNTTRDLNTLSVNSVLDHY